MTLYTFVFAITLFGISCSYERRCSRDRECRNQQIDCVQGEPCQIYCNGKGSCYNATITCPTNQQCVVGCRNKKSCHSITINATYSLELIMEDCATNDFTCIGMSVYCPPNMNQEKKCIIPGDNSMGGTDIFPINFYCLNGWNDLEITADSQYTVGTMHCGNKFSINCSVSDSKWECENVDDLCNDPSILVSTTNNPSSYRPTTVYPTYSPTQLPSSSVIKSTLPTLPESTDIASTEIMYTSTRYEDDDEGEVQSTLYKHDTLTAMPLIYEDSNHGNTENTTRSQSFQLIVLCCVAVLIMICGISILIYLSQRKKREIKRNGDLDDIVDGIRMNVASSPKITIKGSPLSVVLTNDENTVAEDLRLSIDNYVYGNSGSNISVSNIETISMTMNASNQSLMMIEVHEDEEVIGDDEIERYDTKGNDDAQSDVEEDHTVVLEGYNEYSTVQMEGIEYLD